MTLSDILQNIFRQPNGDQSLLGNALFGQKIISPLAAAQPQKAYAQAPPKPAKEVKGASAQYNPTLEALTQKIKRGFEQYGSPLATASADFAQAGYNLQQQHPNVDPLIAAVLSLKETSGGKHMAPNSANNPLNIGPNINYPSIHTNLMGGGTWGANGQPQKGFYGTVTNGNYNDYLNSGDLNDFFTHYTNPYDSSGNKVNGLLPEQISQYNKLRSYFQ